MGLEVLRRTCRHHIMFLFKVDKKNERENISWLLLGSPNSFALIKETTVLINPHLFLAVMPSSHHITSYMLSRGNNKANSPYSLYLFKH